MAEEYLDLLYPDNLKIPHSLDVIEMLDRLEDDPFGILFGVEDLPDNVEGLTDPVDEQIIIDTKVYQKALQGDGRARFTCGHEIGHVQHIPQIGRIVEHSPFRLYRRLNVKVPPYRDPDWQANAVASALLMPRSMVGTVFRDGGLEGIVDVFQVSRPAAERRITVLKRAGEL